MCSPVGLEAIHHSQQEPESTSLDWDPECRRLSPFCEHAIELGEHLIVIDGALYLRESYCRRALLRAEIGD